MKSWIVEGEADYIADYRWRGVGNLHHTGEVDEAQRLMLEIFITHVAFLKKKRNFNPRMVLQFNEIRKEDHARLDVYEMYTPPVAESANHCH